MPFCINKPCRRGVETGETGEQWEGVRLGAGAGDVGIIDRGGPPFLTVRALAV